MAGYRYSLSLVSVVMTFPGASKPARFGGQGSMLGEVTLTRKNERFSAEGDATGGYIVNETLDKTGTCTISIKQFAPLVDTLTNLFNLYDSKYTSGENVYGTVANTSSELISGLNFSDSKTTIALYYNGTLIGRADGCYLNMPDLTLGEESESREFSFECGEVDFEMVNVLNAGVTRDLLAETGAVVAKAI